MLLDLKANPFYLSFLANNSKMCLGPQWCIEDQLSPPGILIHNFEVIIQFVNLIQISHDFIYSFNYNIENFDRKFKNPFLIILMAPPFFHQVFLFSNIWWHIIFSIWSKILTIFWSTLWLPRFHQIFVLKIFGDILCKLSWPSLCMFLISWTY